MINFNFRIMRCTYGAVPVLVVGDYSAAPGVEIGKISNNKAFFDFDVAGWYRPFHEVQQFCKDLRKSGFDLKVENEKIILVESK